MSGLNRRTTSAMRPNDGAARRMSGYGGKATLGISTSAASDSRAAGPWGRTRGYRGATTVQSHPRARNPATESAVTTEHSHPFTAASDMCLVHNGSLSNHNNLRKWLRRRGHDFETDNDSEVAARYFAHRLSEGASLPEALEAGLRDLDGFFTFTMGTRDGFAVLRDGIACKPAVLAETEDWVAMASEFRSLANLPGVETATIWEPKPAVVYTWSLQ